MIKVDLTTNTATREPLPQFLNGLKPQSLQDLSWIDETLGVSNYGFWNEVDVTPALTQTQIYDGTETLTVKSESKTVEVVKGVREKTQKELDAEFKITVPTVVSPRQARLALYGAELLDSVEAAVATNKEYQIFWEYSLDIKRDDAILNAMATSLGLTERQVDDLFIAGGKL